MSHDIVDVKISLFTIWAIGVGSVLGGDFFGWQFVLYGGFLSALFGVIFTGIFYWIYAAVMMELAARYRSSGGSFDFVRNAIGGRASIVMAILGLLKLMLANSANALAISSYLVQAGMSVKLREVCWIITYALFTYLDCAGVKQSANLQVCATAFCVFILLFYSFSTISVFKFKNIASIGYSNGGFTGFMKGLPFALQFFDGFEEVPLLMGYAVEPEVTIPKGLLYCYITITVLAFMILFCGSGGSNSSNLIYSEAPLMDGFDGVFGKGTFISDSLAYFIVIGLVVNFFAFILFVSQQVQAIAEAGYLPRLLAYRHPIHDSPIHASIAASVVGVLLTVSFAYVFGDDAAQNTLVTAALMPAALGYILVLECIVKIRESEINVDSPNKSFRDLTRIGYNPGLLRFKYDTAGARVAQGMCLLFCAGLIVLAFSSLDFFYGLISLAVLGSTSFILIDYNAPKNFNSDIIEIDVSDDCELTSLVSDRLAVN